ncbi:hypothetical protein LCGC14_2603720, partial [marine sediment metagenome]
MSELIILIGPPGCGKTEYTKKLKQHVRVNQDDQGKVNHFAIFAQAIKD